MITGRGRFNIYLVCVLTALAFCGCQADKQDKEKEDEKEYATLKIHMEVPRDMMDFSKQVPIFRQRPVLVNVDKDPFLTEAYVSGAKIVDAPGGWELQISFERRGKWLLEQQTTTNPGKHIAIFAEWGKGLKESRWLAAPVIPRRISNGVLTFTPDATREEMEQLVVGLNNLAAKMSEQDKW